jgi:hypothetical protein
MGSAAFDFAFPVSGLTVIVLTAGWVQANS